MCDNCVWNWTRRYDHHLGKNQKIHDCYGVLERIAWIWRIAGIFPFTLKGPNGYKKYEIDKLYAAYGFLVCCGTVGNCVFSLIQYNRGLRYDCDTRLTLLNRETLIVAFSWRDKQHVSVEFMTAAVRLGAMLLCTVIASAWRILRHKEASRFHEYIMHLLQCSWRYDIDIIRRSCSCRKSSAR